MDGTHLKLSANTGGLLSLVGVEDQLGCAPVHGESHDVFEGVGVHEFLLEKHTHKTHKLT